MVEFYSGCVGLELLASGSESGPEYATMWGTDEVEFLWAELDLGDGQVLELLEYVAGGPNHNDRASKGPSGSHLAIRVADVDSTYEGMSRAGVREMSEPVQIDEEGRWFGSRAFYALDPDSRLVEFIEDAAGTLPGGSDPGHRRRSSCLAEHDEASP